MLVALSAQRDPCSPAAQALTEGSASSIATNNAKMYNPAMTSIPSTAARQRWAQTIDAARRTPITITEHGRETVVVMDVELSRRALAALEDAEDAAAAEEAARAIAQGEETVPLSALARELGFNIG
ncbi:hypothetical protein GCM10009640_09970 [Agrococcus citreus]|uniref:Antitoxin n=2 Tax=Agrococcus citreus TaxID=84643 RepID=A0ABP4JKW2_9MICO